VREDCLNTLREITAVDEEAAIRLLEATDWKVEEALALHFAGQAGGDGFENHATGSTAAPDPYGLGPTGVSPAPAPAGPSVQQTPSIASSSMVSLAPSPRSADGEEASASPAQSLGGGWFSSLGQTLTSLGQAVLGIAPQDFEAWFSARYGDPTPPMSKDCFGDANKQALQGGRLLLIWFHQDESNATDKLCREVLQNSLVCDHLSRSYILWAGDVCRFEPGQIARLLNVTTFPTLVVCQPLRSGFEAFGAEGFCLEWPLGSFAQPLLRLTPAQPGEALNTDEVIAALTGTAEDHNDAVRVREEEVQRRDLQLAEERRLREEQDREYEEALLADQLAEVAALEQVHGTSAAQPEAASSAAADAGEATGGDGAEEGEKKEDAAAAAAARQEAEAEEQRRLARGAALLALPEPSPGAGPLAKLSLRLPSGDRLQRSFLAEAQVSEVYEWAHCCRPKAEPAGFELCTNFPVRALTDRSATLQASGLCPSAALLLKAVEED